VQCADAFHVVVWATEALDEIRRETWNTARQMAAATRRECGGRRRNPENQHAKLAWIDKTEPPVAPASEIAAPRRWLVAEVRLTE
jgi:transposase